MSDKVEIDHSVNLANMFSHFNRNNQDVPISSATYFALSNIMKDYPGEWDGYKRVITKDGKETSVFEVWVKSTVNKINEVYPTSNNSDLDIAYRFREDIGWWIKNKGKPSISDKGLSYIATNFSAFENANEGERALAAQEWAGVCLDFDLVTSKDLLREFLVSAIIIDNTNIVERIVKNYDIDITKMVLERGNGAYFASFIKSEAMAKSITNLGFKWDSKYNDGTSVLRGIQKKNKEYFVTNKERYKVMVFLDSLSENPKKTHTQEAVWALLREAKSKDDVALALKGVNWKNIRDSAGKNVLHMIAQYTPRDLKKYASSKAGVFLLNQRDCDNRTPLEYFYGYGNNCNVSCNFEWIKELREKNEIPKSDLMEVKWINMSNSYRDSFLNDHFSYNRIDSGEWKQKTTGDLITTLKSPRGQKFLEQVYNLQATTQKSFSSGGVRNIIKKLDFDFERYNMPNFRSNFIKEASTKAEIRVALLDSLFAISSMIRKSGNDVAIAMLQIDKLRGQVTDLMDKAVSLGIDIYEIKNKIGNSDFMKFGEVSCSRFDKVMRATFPAWSSMKADVDSNPASVNIEGASTSNTLRSRANGLSSRKI